MKTVGEISRRPGLPAAARAALDDRLGERVSYSEAVRSQHGHSETHFPPCLPDAVVFVENTDEVVFVVGLCAAHDIKLTAYGAGTSIEGSALPIAGGISLDMSRMNRVLSVNADDFDVTVEAGVTRIALNNHLRDQGLFFPVDPGADATIGGMASTRASGTNAVRYGTMKDNVLATTTVLAGGRVMRTGGRARKSSAGYDLTRLLVGSEGTLGVMTELTVRLYPIPEAISAAVCTFPTIEAAVQTVIQTIQLGVPVARIELLDALSLSAINRFSKTTLAEAPTLFFEFHGSPAGVEEQAQTVQAIADELGGANFEWATRPEDRSRLWQARHDAYFACLQLKPGCRCFPTDVCVPISRLAECIDATYADIAQVSIPIALFGHVGDGNFHLVVLVDPENPQEMSEAAWISERVVERAIAMDGTCTGEHGIGLGKRKYLVREHGNAAVDAMRAIKAALDPDNLLNPGKVLPETN